MNYALFSRLTPWLYLKVLPSGLSLKDITVFNKLLAVSSFSSIVVAFTQRSFQLELQDMTLRVTDVIIRICADLMWSSPPGCNTLGCGL